MVKKVKHLLGKSLSKKIFIVGTGRSGTHWLGYILKHHPEIRATIEKNPGFRWSKEMALNHNKRNKNYSKMVWYYWWQHLCSVPRHYVDKSHPNLWITEKLNKTFEDALFLGIQRNPYATVSSMLNHEGVKKWHKKWKKFPIPNEFLGIKNGEKEKYENYSLTMKCAMRWKSHKIKMEEENKRLKNMLVVRHENLVTKTEGTAEKIKEFIGLEKDLEVEKVDYKTLDKWRKRLSKKDILDIEKVTGIHKSSVATSL